MKISRRDLIKTGFLRAPLISLPSLGNSKPSSIGSRIKLGVSTYSYWHFRPPKVSINTIIEKASPSNIVAKLIIQD
jgi:L-ribulose-5-phosphate 3-epimerase